MEWKNNWNGYKAETKEGADVVVTDPDSLGNCEIYYYINGDEIYFGTEFGTDAAKRRAEELFK